MRSGPQIPERAFPVSMKKFYLAAIPAGIMVFYLAYMGISGLRSQAARLDFLSRVLLGYAPLILCGFILLVLVVTFLANRNRTAVVRPINFEYRIGGKIVGQISWPQVIFTPSKGRPPFRRFVISDGEQYFTIEEFFFPDYELIERVVVAATTRKNELVI